MGEGQGGGEKMKDSNSIPPHPALSREGERGFKLFSVIIPHSGVKSFSHSFLKV
jgi:hypothetical protein